jgi:uncharacterized protein YprB with RNaseH-like and TPR domain
MITRQFPVDLTLQHQFENDLDQIVFFDIETTGFSADITYLYLIGCIYYKAPSFQLIQWFSEDIHEESLLITSFFEFLKNYKVLVHYNGSGFDIPYLLRKCASLKLDYSLDNINSIDLFKKITPYKKLFHLSNYKQKSIEAFLKVKRIDTFDGGDLIEVYQSYLGKKHIETLKKARNPELLKNAPSEADQLLLKLLLHNEDDIKGLVCICPILNYADIFEKPIRILQAGVEEDNFVIHFELSSLLPVPVSFGNDLIYVSAHEKAAYLKVSIYEGELKFFYDNYKEYFYLPAEDQAVHQSLAYYVDKEYRVKAKPSNCYTRKQGLFVPQYENIITPYFKQSYQDKMSFLEIHTDFLLQEENLERYVHHILNYLMQTK